MKPFFIHIAAWLLAMLILLGIIIGILAIRMSDTPDVENGSYLTINLISELPEYDPPGDVMSQIMGSSPLSLQTVLTNMEKAEVDDRIEGVVIKVATSLSVGTGGAQEIRQAIKRVQKSGKKVYAYLESMDKKSYLIAAACDEIVSPKTAYNNFIGFQGRSMHVKNALEKLGIKPNIHKIKDYKSAAEMVIREDMSEPARENRQWILDDIWDMCMEALEKDRGLTEEQIVAIMQEAMLSTERCVELGMIDKSQYWDELKKTLQADEEEFKSISLSSYAKVDAEDLGFKAKKKIAVVHAQGTIGGRKNSVNPLLGTMMGYETIVSELEKVMEDDDVVAVVFRVDSGGGDAFGSDMMGHQIEVLAQKKPVVVSMVDVAASGGYHISYRANHIMANPMTICGSIGSISGKFNNSELMTKLGITFSHIEKGPNAQLYNSGRDFTEEEWELFTADHWRGFNEWLADVAEHRGMTFEDAEKLAHGRVFTGRQSLENGLVDSLGGLHDAIAKARELAEKDNKLEAGAKIVAVHYPKKQGLIDMLMGGDMASVAKWATIRMVRDDIKNTYQMTSESVWMVEDLTVE